MDIYHVLNRGVDKRDIFLDSQDYARFVHELYEFNDTRPADNLHRLFNPGMKELRTPSFRRPREMLVDIHGWCLMKNHYHLLLSERTEGGITRFLRKLNIGYAMYFNQRYERSGTLFQGRTKKVRVAQHAHALYILHYIHLNPLDYLEGAGEWRERDKGRLHDTREALRYLDQYRWSSYLDYASKKNFPSLIRTALFADILGDYPASIKAYLNDHAMLPFSLE